MVDISWDYASRDASFPNRRGVVKRAARGSMRSFFASATRRVSSSTPGGIVPLNRARFREREHPRANRPRGRQIGQCSRPQNKSASERRMRRRATWLGGSDRLFFGVFFRLVCAISRRNVETGNTSRPEKKNELNSPPPFLFLPPPDPRRVRCPVQREDHKAHEDRVREHGVRALVENGRARRRGR